MKTLAIATLLALGATPAAAGGFSFGFGFHKKGKSVSVQIGNSHSRGHKQAHRHGKVWVPGHYDTVSRQVWVPGRKRRVWQAAEIGYRYDRCGRRVSYVVRPAGFRVVRRPGHYVTRYEKVWVPGHFEKRGRRRHR